MADKKISQLTGATTPLAGTEVLPIVQSGSTVKVAVSDLTAGRAVAASILNPAVGAVGAPSVTFGTDSTSGFYRNAANQVSFASSGAQALTIGPTTLTLAGGLTGGSTYVSQGFSGYRASGASISTPGDASIYFNTATGQTLQARAGSSYDWSLINPGNANYIVRVPTGTLDFEVAGGNVKFGTAAKGIDFSANTHAAGMTSELLNWYEQGTWTPTITGSTSAGTGTYSTQIGRYTRVGNIVHCQAYIVWSAHTGTGNLWLTGLPFTMLAVTDSHSSGSIGIFSNVALTAGNVAIIYGSPNTTRVNLAQYPTGGGAQSSVPIDAAGEIAYSIVYTV